MRQFSFPVLRFLSSKNVFLCVETSEKSFFFTLSHMKKKCLELGAPEKKMSHLSPPGFRTLKSLYLENSCVGTETNIQH